MRILQICSARYIGGGERHVIDLSNELARRGHDVFLALATDSPVAGKLVEIPERNITYLPFRNSIDISSAFALRRLVSDNRIEIINAHLAKDYPLAAFAAHTANVPYVVTRHVLFSMSRLHRVLLSQARSVIAPSNAVAESLRRDGVFPAARIRTVRYGLDTRERDVVRTSDSGIFRIGAIGNLDPVKGFDILVDAARIVTKTFPDVMFEIIGSDRTAGAPNELELKRLIEKLGLQRSIELTGFSEDIPGKLSTFEIFVSSSRSESFGFVIAEAMLAGLPVIATATEGAREIISDPSLGVIVPTDSSEKLAAEIIELVQNVDRRKRLGSAGPAHIRANFSLERMVKETEAVYREAIEGNP